LFTYSTPIEDIAERYAAGEGQPDDLLLLQILRPISDDEAEARGLTYDVRGSFGRSLRGINERPKNGYYTCRAWDEDTRLCTIYEDRPNMCRGYPYGNACSHGCDWQAPDEVLIETGYMTPEAWFKKPYV
jgi:Fe-S-cluster containining protein